MKKILVALAIAAFASTATALVENGPHDMRGQGGAQGLCLYCHAAHLWVDSDIGSGTGAPLWNRNQSQTITAYGTTVAGTVITTPGSQSRTCLSCHDGLTDYGAVNNGTAEAIGTMTTSPMAVGTDLTDDHPVGTGIPAANTEYRTPTTSDNVKLSTTSSVECSSCHDPHIGAAGDKFLRVANGDFCHECHVK